WTGVDVEAAAGLIDFDGGRQDFVVERHDGFKKSGGAGGGFGVADLAFDGAERAPLFVVGFLVFGVEGHAEAVEFGEVAGFGAGSVGFDEFDGLWAVAGLIVGAGDG